IIFPQWNSTAETRAVSRTAVSGALDGSRAVLCVLGAEDSHPGAAPLSARHNPRTSLLVTFYSPKLTVLSQGPEKCPPPPGISCSCP
uniref:Uncharacterized protein n=1 Tax=Accipiter nisus TaxID=211598 RepID=A0A8B9NAV0_9AVES